MQQLALDLAVFIHALLDASRRRHAAGACPATSGGTACPYLQCSRCAAHCPSANRTATESFYWSSREEGPALCLFCHHGLVPLEGGGFRLEQKKVELPAGEPDVSRGFGCDMRSLPEEKMFVAEKEYLPL